jgi:two-component system, chemotaxis family, sensor kinase Cph1
MSSSLASPNSFEQRIALLQQGEHLCSVYSATAEMLSQVVPYMKAGLLNGERCIYVADECSKETIIDGLRFWGVDAPRHITNGQLVFWTRHDYRQPGTFQLDVMLGFVQRTLQQALLDGHSGIRLAVEMSWTINNGITNDDLIKWEDFINTISFAGSQVSFLCQYNRRTLPSPLIGKAVQVHPVIVFGQDVCPNLYTRPAAEVLNSLTQESLDSVLRKSVQQQA